MSNRLWLKGQRRRNAGKGWGRPSNIEALFERKAPPKRKTTARRR